VRASRTPNPAAQRIVSSESQKARRPPVPKVEPKKGRGCAVKIAYSAPLHWCARSLAPSSSSAPPPTVVPQVCADPQGCGGVLLMKFKTMKFNETKAKVNPQPVFDADGGLFLCVVAPDSNQRARQFIKVPGFAQAREKQVYGCYMFNLRAYARVAFFLFPCFVCLPFLIV